VRKAEADYRAAVKLGPGSEDLRDQICFHCQQCAEKYLKALLQEAGLVVPRTHILRSLQTPLLSHHSSLRRLGRGLGFLTRFAVDTRYPGDSAGKRETEAALRWADRVRAEAQTILGLPLRTPRRMK
jgi:HEPN domain-containing protein